MNQNQQMQGQNQGQQMMGAPKLQAPGAMAKQGMTQVGMAQGVSGPLTTQTGQKMQMVQLPNGTMALQPVPNQNQMGNPPGQMNQQGQMQMNNQMAKQGMNQQPMANPGMQRQGSPQPTMIQGPNGQMMQVVTAPGTTIVQPGQMQMVAAPGTTIINNVQGQMNQQGQMQMNQQGQMQGSPPTQGQMPMNASTLSQPMNQSGMQAMQQNMMQNQANIQQQQGMNQPQFGSAPQFGSIHPDILQNGDTIELCNLVKQPALNGKIGTVIQAEVINKGTKFVAVRLSTDAPDAKPKMLKPENVRKPFAVNERVELCELTQDVNLNGAPAVILNLNFIDQSAPGESLIQVNTPAGVKIVKKTNIRKARPQQVMNASGPQQPMFASNGAPMMTSSGQQVMFASAGLTQIKVFNHTESTFLLFISWFHKFKMFNDSICFEAMPIFIFCAIHQVNSSRRSRCRCSSRWRRCRCSSKCKASPPSYPPSQRPPPHLRSPRSQLLPLRSSKYLLPQRVEKQKQTKNRHQK
jgi:hypothetical protein